MAKKPNRTAKIPHVEADEALRRHRVMDEAIFNFRGGIDELEGALGMYMIGRHFGWKVLYLIHTKKPSPSTKAFSESSFEKSSRRKPSILIAH